jgi:hypothetical protein
MCKSIITVFWLLFLTIQANSQHTLYYSTIPLRESPYPRPQGVVCLTKDQALSRKHYRIEFDKKNRVVSTSFWHNVQREHPNHTANYFMQASIQKIEYSGNKEILTYYDKFENPVTLGGGVVKEIYVLDSLGKRMNLYFEDESGNRVENRWGIAEYSWEVQVDGSILEDRIGLDGEPRNIRTGFPFQRIRLCYEPNGLLALMQNIDEEGNLENNETGVAQDRIHFDEEGRWYGWSVLDSDGNLKEGNGPGVASAHPNSLFIVRFPFVSSNQFSS